MKQIYLLTLSLLLSTFVFAQPITIGTGSVTTSNSPYNSYFSYSYAQTIYSKNEIAATGNITSISFNFAGTSLLYSDSITVYMGVVSKEFFNSATDWVPLSALTQVYKNQLTGYVVPGKITIALPVPFAYNGSGNLVIAVDENKPNRNSTVRYSGTSVTPANRVLYYADNITNPNPAAPPAGILSGVVGNIIINGLTFSPCKNPITNVTVSNLSAIGTAAVAKWSKLVLGVQSPSQYLWELRKPGFAPSDGTNGLIFKGTITDTTVVLDSLNISTAYTFFVKPQCGVADFGNWTSGTTFTTDCIALNIPYSEDFNVPGTNNLPGCMANEYDNSNYQWIKFGDQASLDISESYLGASFSTPGLNLVGGKAYRLKFYLSYSFSQANLGGQVNVRLLKNGSFIRTLYSSNGQRINSTNIFTIDFMPNVSGVYKVFFGAYTQNEYYFSGTVDNILVTESPLCIAPLLYSATGIATNAATCSWQPTITPTTNYDIYRSNTNTPPNATTVPSNTGIGNTSFSFSSLTANTKYYYWVRANCGSNGYSDWSTTDSFTTNCEATTLPYAIDFESSLNLPECTNMYGFDEGYWSVSNGGFSPQSFYSLQFEFNYYDDFQPTPTAWFYTRGVYLTGGTTYNLSFNYASNAYWSMEGINAYYGTSYSAMNNLIASYDIDYTYGVNNSSNNFTPSTSGIFYIGFYAYSDPANGSGSVFLDDIYVTQVSPCMEPRSIIASNIAQTSASINWSVQSPGSTTDMYVSTSNTTPSLTATPTQSGIASTTTNLGGLLQNTKYFVWVRANCGGQGKSIWSLPTGFTTLQAAGITSVTAAKNPICANTTTILTAIGVEGTNAIVTWWTGTGGTGTNLGTGLFLTNRGAGTYYARVTASVGSPVEAMYRVSVYPGSGASQTSVTICNSYTWNGVTYRQSGSYTFNTTTAAGCDSVATLRLTILSVSSTFTKMDAGCYGSATGSLTVTPTSGTGPYTYRLGTIGTYGTANTFTSLKAGNYRVSILEATGCAGLTAQIAIGQSPIIAATVVQTNINCYGAFTGAITANGAKGTAPYTYRLGTAGAYTATNTFSNLKAGSYRVYILDAKGCGGNVVVTLTQPTSALMLSIVKKDVICRGAATGVLTATATGGTAPYLFKIGLNGNYVTLGTFGSLPAGSYTLYTKDAKGCVASTVIIILQPTTAVAGSIVKTNVNCFGGATGSITVSATGGSTPYQYSLGNAGLYSTVNTFSGLRAGSYNVYVKDSVGCIFNPATTVNQPLAIAAGFTKKDERCPGAKDGSITVSGVGGTPPYTYRFGSSGAYATINTFTGLGAGSYRVFVNDANGCTGYSIAITVAQLSATCFAQSPIAKSAKTVSEINGSSLSLKLFPNPSTSQFSLQVHAPVQDAVTIRVVDVNGKTVYTTKGSPEQSFFFGKNLSPGIYLVEVSQGQEVITAKVIKGNR